MENIVVQFYRFREADADIPLPSYETTGSAGMDVAAAVSEVVVIPPGEIALIPTGFGVALPAGYEMQVRPRSGLALKHGITLINSPGTIDADYRGEVKVPLINHGKKPFAVNRGDRIAQLVVAQVAAVSLVSVDSLPPTSRNDGGFGHTGT
jgi:dUTP pyrophosphatase